MNRHFASLLVLFLSIAASEAESGQVLSATTTLHDPNRAGSNTWSQSISTGPGSGYQVSFTLSQSNAVPNQNVELVVTSGALTPIDTVFTAPETGSEVRTATFVASDASATLTFNDQASSSSDSVTTLVITVVSLIPYEHPGHYTGIQIRGRSLPGATPAETITSSEQRSVNCRINAAGQMFFMMEPEYDSCEGTINNEGEATYYNDDSVVGAASYENGILRLHFRFSNRLGGNFNDVEWICTRDFTLHRVGN